MSARPEVRALVTAAVAVAMRRPGELGADRLAALRDACDDLGEVGTIDPVEQLVLAAADCVTLGLSPERHEALRAAVKVWTTQAAAESDPGTPEADPAYWWQKGAMG